MDDLAPAARFELGRASLSARLVSSEEAVGARAAFHHKRPAAWAQVAR